MRVKVGKCFKCKKDLLSPKDRYDKSFYTCPVCRTRFCPRCWELFRREKTDHPCSKCKNESEEKARRKKLEEIATREAKKRAEKEQQENLVRCRETLRNVLENLKESGFYPVELELLLKDFPSVAKDYIYTSGIVQYLAEKLNINSEEITCNDYYAVGISGSSSEIVFLGRKYVLLDCLPHVDEPKKCFSLNYLWLLKSTAQEPAEPPIPIAELKTLIKATKEENEIRARNEIRASSIF